MEMEFDNPKHETLVNDYEALSRKYDKKGQNTAEDILVAVEVLKSANTLFDVPHSYRPHPLSGEYKGCFSIHVDAKYRIIFKPNHNGDPDYRIDNYKSIKKITILEIYKDYHKE